MKMRVLAACLLAMASGGAVAQSEADTKEVQNELAYQKAVNDLLMARYPDFDGGKSGNIQNAEKLAGMAALLMPQAVMAIGSSVAHDFSGCGAGTVILSGSGLSERLLDAESQRIELAELERELDIKPEAGGVDITGMTPVVDEKIAAADLAAPASAPARPAFATPAARPAFASRMETPAQAGAPAMVWQRGAVSSTDALQQQFASQAVQQPHHAPLSSVRSTVALDERFTLTSVLNTSTTPREAGAELVLPGGGGARTAAFEAAPGVASPTGAEGGATGDSTGGSSGDTLPGDQTGQGQDGTRAEREAEGPTVSHWGTQHLRHASLRVGESGTDAIDIQLSMKGQEVQVAFQSDSAEARASLRESASDALTELLQRSGIQLGNVSVGTQGQQQGGHSPHTPTVSRGETIGKAEPAVATPPSPRPSPRADGSQPLDLFV